MQSRRMREALGASGLMLEPLSASQDLHCAKPWPSWGASLRWLFQVPNSCAPGGPGPQGPAEGRGFRSPKNLAFQRLPGPPGCLNPKAFRSLKRELQRLPGTPGASDGFPGP